MIAHQRNVLETSCDGTKCNITRDRSKSLLQDANGAWKSHVSSLLYRIACNGIGHRRVDQRVAKLLGYPLSSVVGDEDVFT